MFIFKPEYLTGPQAYARLLLGGFLKKMALFAPVAGKDPHRLGFGRAMPFPGTCYVLSARRPLNPVLQAGRHPG